VALLGKLLGVGIVVVAIFAGALFALQNTQPLAVDLLVTTLPERSSGLWLLCSLGLGIFLGLAAGTTIILNQRARLAAVRRHRDRLNTEVDRLRKAGLTASE